MDDTYYDGGTVEEAEFAGDFYDLGFEWSEVVEADER